MSQGAAGDVCEDLLHDDVAAVLSLGLDQLERGVGEDRVLCRAGGYAEPRPRMAVRGGATS
jgi:hypothetical protein